MAQNNFYDGFDKNSQEAPGQARFFGRIASREAMFTRLIELPVEPA
jgi:hypothetical protein